MGQCINNLYTKDIQINLYNLLIRDKMAHTYRGEGVDRTTNAHTHTHHTHTHVLYLQHLVLVIEHLHVYLHVLVRPLGPLVEQPVTQTQVHVVTNVIWYRVDRTGGEMRERNGGREGEREGGCNRGPLI